jgi:GMP synthase-like glutamine amidotransferase
MKVGIFNYMRSESPKIEKVVCDMGFDVVMYDYKENHYKIMKDSDIKYWIFTGSPIDVNKDTSPQLDKRILRMDGKRVFLICYSMESILEQLGCKLVKRERNRKKIFLMDILYSNYLTTGLCSPIRAWRNHETFIPVLGLTPNIKLQMKFEGEVMTCFYKNSTMTQWHPEHSDDGKRFLLNWLNR